MELQNSMKTTFQKSQTLEQITKNIQRAVTIYHDQRKSNKLRKQSILITNKIANTYSLHSFSDAKSKKPRTSKKFITLISKFVIECITQIYFKLMRHPL